MNSRPRSHHGIPDESRATADDQASRKENLLVIALWLTDLLLQAKDFNLAGTESKLREAIGAMALEAGDELPLEVRRALHPAWVVRQ